jgi:hypothetical protein
MVISSPIFLPINPAQVSAVTTNGGDSSGYHSTPSIPETTSLPPPATPINTARPALTQEGDFSTQAALSLTRASQTNNFVNSKAYYDISFRTATAGAIKKVVMDFPVGTSVGSALVVEAVGIGPGTLAASAGEVLTYTVTNAVNIPVNTIIRIQMSNINNPPNPSNSLTVIITTRDPADAIIDGPTNTLAYNLKQIVTTDISNGAVTNAKIANNALSLEAIERPGPNTDIPPGMIIEATASCNLGEELVGGGNDMGADFAFDIRYADGQEVGPGEWRVRVGNAGTGNMDVIPLAYCVPPFP